MTKVGKSHSKGTFAGAFGNDEDAPRPAILRVANNEEYGIIGRNPGVENGARSRRGSGLRFEDSVRCAVCPSSPIHALSPQ
jgi:hypothetical protein